MYVQYYSHPFSLNDHLNKGGVVVKKKKLKIKKAHWEQKSERYIFKAVVLKAKLELYSHGLDVVSIIKKFYYHTQVTGKAPLLRPVKQEQ